MSNTENLDSSSFGLENQKNAESASTPRIVFEKTLEDGCTIRLCGEVGLPSAVRLKALLLEWLAAYQKFDLDLSEVSVSDVTLMQLILATELESPARKGALVSKISPAADEKARSVGFAGFPGLSSRDKRN